MSPPAAPLLRAIAAEPRQARAEEEPQLVSSRRAIAAAPPSRMCVSFAVWAQLPRLQPHIAAVRLPEAAHRSLGDAVVVGGNARAAHLHDREQIRGGGDRALHEAWRGAVLHRNIAGRADQIGLAQAALGHLRVIADKAEAGPHELRLVEA